jgi:hypothetical protein
MSHLSTSKILVIGGTGAQGLAVVRGLVEDGRYSCRILTRDATSARAKSLEALGNVELFEGTFANQQDLHNAFKDCDGAFVNIDGFNTGEKTEIFWGIRSFEIAVEEGIKFFVYGNLDYGYKKSGYDPKFRCGHYDGKGRVGEWILAQTKDLNGRIGSALFTTGPYIEMTIGHSTPMMPSVEDGVVTWRVPLGQGAVPHVSLQDCGYYVRWLFDHPERANGLDLEVAVDHIHYADLAEAFSKVTGHPAQYVDVGLEEYWTSGPLSRGGQHAAGYNADPNDKATMSVQDNFTGFWNLWKHSGKNEGVIQRDYKLLDEIHPNRIKTAEEWFRRENEAGIKLGKGSLWERVQPKAIKPVLKIAEDNRRGRL